LEEPNLSDIIKNSRYQLLLNNITKGKLGEQIAKLDYINNGYSIQRTGIGSDFIAIKNEGDSDSVICEFVEVKTGKARPSKRQQNLKRKAKRSGKMYTIYRINDSLLSTYLDSVVNEQRRHMA
jgi:predicted Holliday junction resolvase-like endonuclease